MKLKLLITFLIALAMEAPAQDLQSVQRFIAGNDYKTARLQIDSILSNGKNTNEASPWYYKGKIYTEFARRDSFNTSLLREAMSAYRRYQELDPKNKLMELDNNVGLFQLYDLNYNQGVKSYNEQDYLLAYNCFKNALEVEEYISRKKFSFNGKTFPMLDTQLVSLTGFSAYLAKKEEESIPYFEKLADLKMAGEEYKGVYTLLFQHFQKKNDAVRSAKYLAMGRQLFPDTDYWIKLELGNPAGAKEKFVRYEQLLQKNPTNYDLSMNYAVDLFNYVYADQHPTDYTARQERLQSLLLKLTTQNPSSAYSNYVMSQHLLNQVYYLDDELNAIKGETAGDEAKKKALNAKITARYEDLLIYSQKGLDLYEQAGNMGATEKANCRKLVEQLISCYERKKQADKVAVYRERLKGY